MAKLEIVRADYRGLEVSFTEEGWFNATEAADRFGKRVADWLENLETKEYISALAECLKVPKERDLVKAKRGRNGGTWLHPKLGVAFARWLDVKFAVWCDLQIDSLIRKEHPHYDWKRIRHEATSSFKVMNDILKDARTEIGKATATHHYSNEARLINWVLTGKFDSIDRDSLSIVELDILTKLEVRNAVLIGRGLPYDDRKKMLEQYAIDMRPMLVAL